MAAPEAPSRASTAEVCERRPDGLLNTAVENHGHGFLAIEAGPWLPAFIVGEMAGRLEVFGWFLALLLAGCSGAPNAGQSESGTFSSPTSNSAYPTTEEQVCASAAWPRPLPQVVGLSFNEVYSGALGCWNDVRGLAPDGHDVTLVKGPMGNWTIVAISPPPGTELGRDDPVNVTVAPDDVTRAVVRPCDWVTATEVETISGFSSVETVPFGDFKGAVNVSCSYLGAGEHELITSSLMLPGSFPIDPRSELEFMKSGGGEAVAGLPGDDAHCNTYDRSSKLLILLGSDRTYQVMGNGTCEQLRKIAQAALARIPA